MTYIVLGGALNSTHSLFGIDVLITNYTFPVSIKENYTESEKKQDTLLMSITS